MKMYPIGIQHFPKLRETGALYIDKTKEIYSLVMNNAAIFLSRPRRFGKSLLVSTLEALFEGKREYFSGLWIDSSDYKWGTFPVVRLDLSRVSSDSIEALSGSLQTLLLEVAEKYQVTGVQRPRPQETLSALIIELYKKGPVVILIDEYDKPLVYHLEDLDIAKKNRDLLRDFYITIKALDEYLRFVFVTGVSKFSKVSIFSGMNNLKEICLYETYADLLGITEREIATYLTEDVTEVAKKRGETKQETLDLMKIWYNGYRYGLAPSTVKVHNPVSLFSFLETANLDNYWFSTATPTFAMDLIRKRGFPVEDFENGVVAGKEIDTSHDVEDVDISTLLFQTGYLTIQDYDEKTQTFFLKFPNEEVRRSFLEHLLRVFAEKQSTEIHGLLYKLSNYLQKKDLSNFFAVFNGFLASVPHQIHKEAEGYYHSLLYLFLKVIGFRVEAEVSTAIGRMDMVLKSKTSIFIFEFKINQTADAALQQIIQRGYDNQFALDRREVILVGVNFDTNLRTITDWKKEGVHGHSKNH